MNPEFDIFGHRVREGFGKRGRPPYEPCEKDRNKVKLLLALGWANQRIANAIGVSLATLKRYFRAELKVRDAMRDRLEARRIEIAMEQANSGNIAALKELGAMIDRNDRMTIEAAMGSAEPEKQVSRVGKKIEDQDRAMQADADLMAELTAEAEQGGIRFDA